jgi:hypothetical protein
VDQDIKDVGGGRLIASVKDADGNLIGILQDALPASACDRKRSIRGFCGHDHRSRGKPESALCPLIAAGFCERAGRVTGAHSARAAAPQAPLTRPPGSGSCQARGQGVLVVRGVVQRFRLAAFLCGVTCRGGRGRGMGSQPYLGPRGTGAAPAA